MIKALMRILKQDKEKLHIPRSVQQVIPVKRVWPDGVWMVGNKYSKCWRFTDINYEIASKEDKTAMFLDYSCLLYTSIIILCSIPCRSRTGNGITTIRRAMRSCGGHRMNFAGNTPFPLSNPNMRGKQNTMWNGKWNRKAGRHGEARSAGMWIRLSWRQ